jgi:hypothetical protein
VAAAAERGAQQQQHGEAGERSHGATLVSPPQRVNHPLAIEWVRLAPLAGDRIRKHRRSLKILRLPGDLPWSVTPPRRPGISHSSRISSASAGEKLRGGVPPA